MFGIARTLSDIVFGVISFLLSLRFVFSFFVVNASTPFVAWVYGVTAPLVSPFARIFPDLDLGNFVVDFSALTALIIYALVGQLIRQAFYYSGSGHISRS